MQTKEYNIAKIGIIAGKGYLPLEIINALIKTNREFFVVVMNSDPHHDYINYPHVVLPITKVGSIINAFKEHQVQELVLAGSVAKPSLKNLQLDAMGVKLLTQITKKQLFGDDSILSNIITFLEDQDFIVRGADYFIPNIISLAGNLSNIIPDDEAIRDMNLGKEIIHTIGGLDIGQGIMIDQGVVLGIEAIEGTTSLIKRCATLKLSHTRSGCLVKMKKPLQERRVDLPSIGVDTVVEIHQANFAGIAIEAGNALIIDRQKVIEAANNLNIFITAI